MTAGLDYTLAFVTGILGSGHCLGMCGSLASACFLRLKANSPGPYAAYHAARISVYGVVGLVAAALGVLLAQAGLFGRVQGILQIVAGIVVILLGLDMAGWSPLRNRFGFAPMSFIQRLFGNAPKHGPVAGAAIAGMVNGLMPCSMTMAMAVKAGTAAAPWEGALFMLAFGAGTLPSMLSASVLFGRLGARARSWMTRIAGVFVVALGVSTLWQGLRYYDVIRKLAY